MLLQLHQYVFTLIIQFLQGKKDGVLLQGVLDLLLDLLLSCLGL